MVQSGPVRAKSVRVAVSRGLNMYLKDVKG